MLDSLIQGLQNGITPISMGVPISQLSTISDSVSPIMVWLLLAVTGAIFGSFLHVVASRFLAEESIVSPPSRCTHCDHPLAWYDNIPVIGWLSLLGKCRYCKAPIPAELLITELATAALFMAVGWKFNLGWHTLFWLYLACNLVVIFITDFKEHLIFEINSLSLIPVGLALHLLGWGVLPGFALHSADTAIWTLPMAWGDMAISYGLISALIGMLASIVFFEGIIFISQKFLGTDGFGHGDTHLMMGIGAFVGWEGMVAGLFLGFVLQTVLAFPILAWQWLRHGQWVILFSGIFSGVFALLPYLGKSLFPSMGIDPVMGMMACLVGSVLCLLVFLRELRNQESYVYVPLGPALILGSVAVMAVAL